MTCPEPGTWRAWMDREAPVPNAEAHLGTCARCSGIVARLRDDAGASAAALAVLGPATASHADSAAADEDRGPVVPSRLRRPRRWVSAAAAAVVLFGVVATPTGRDAAAAFLSAFRSERFSVVEVTEGDAEDAAAVLSRLGTVDGSVDGHAPEPVADVAAAEQAVGFRVATPVPSTLPPGVGATPQVVVAEARELRFTFDSARTRAYLDERGVDTAVPEGYDGATLLVSAPAAAALTYRGDDELLVVGTSQPVTADVDGAISLDALRAFLLDLPGFPPQVAQQLRAIDDWRATLPIPVPVDVAAARQTTVAGAEAVLVTEPGLGSGLLWQRDGRIVGVAGSIDEAALRSVADGVARR